MASLLSSCLNQRNPTSRIDTNRKYEAAEFSFHLPRPSFVNLSPETIVLENSNHTIVLPIDVLMLWH